MSRLLVATVLALLWTAVTTAGDTPPDRSIDLNKPGALETLRRSNPAHYEKLAKTVLERGPGIVQMLQDFQMALTAKAKGGPVAQVPPSSGVF